MLALISPAKKLDFETESSIAEHSQPDFLEQASALVKKAHRLSRSQLAQTMKLSDALAELNYQRFKSFSTPFDLLNRRGTTWRKLPEGDKIGIDEEKAIELMLEFPALIKRPVFESDGKIIVGFQHEQKDALLARD